MSRPTRARQRASQDACIYARISRDAESEERGVGRQVDDCRHLASRLDLRVIGEFVDNDISASTRSTKRRPEYERMLDAVARGEIGVILAYSNSRLTRKPREFDDLIDLHEKHGVEIKTCVSGQVDLSTADGRGLARTLAAWDAAEAERTAERVTRASRERAERGIWHGGWAPYGYRYARDEKDRINGIEVNPDHAAVINEVVPRLLAGETLYGLCLDLNRRGLRTAPGAKAREGKTWTPTTLRRAVMSPALVGKREYDGELFDGKWRPILDEETWHRVRDLLSDPARVGRSGGPRLTGRKHALLGIVHCGTCGRAMTAQPYNGKPTLVCMATAVESGDARHLLRINYQPVEDRVVRFLMERLDTNAFRRAASRKPAATGDEAALRRALDADKARLVKAQDDYTDGLFDRADFERQQRRLKSRIEDTRKQLAAIQRARAKHDMPQDATSVRHLWERTSGDDPADVERRRALLAHYVDRITINPHPEGSPTNVTRRHSEDQEAFEKRQQAVLRRNLDARVKIKWATLT